MKRSTKRLLSFIVSVLLVVGAGFVYSSLISPLYSQLSAIRGELQQKQQILEAEKNVKEQYQKLVSSIDPQKAAQIAQVLPAVPDLAMVLAQFQGMAAADGVQIQGIGFASPTIDSLFGATGRGSTASLIRPVGVITIQLRFAGAYQNIKAMIRHVESNLRVFQVRDVVVQPALKPNQDMYLVDAKLAVYYQSPAVSSSTVTATNK